MLLWWEDWVFNCRNLIIFWSGGCQGIHLCGIFSLLALSKLIVCFRWVETIRQHSFIFDLLNFATIYISWCICTPTVSCCPFHGFTERSYNLEWIDTYALLECIVTMICTSHLNVVQKTGWLGLIGGCPLLFLVVCLCLHASWLFWYE